MKAKKTKKKSKSASHHGKVVREHSHHHETNVKAIISLFVLLVAFSILILFYTYKDSIIQGGQFQLFMTLTIVGMGFLIGLLYLINKHPQK